MIILAEQIIENKQTRSKKASNKSALTGIRDTSAYIRVGNTALTTTKIST